jgi:redox-sensing transcriptional repressor
MTPEPTIRRLAKYLELLKIELANGTEEISTTKIANIFELDPTQVRKDIEFTGIIGKPKTGYNVRELYEGIINFLNWKEPKDAFLAGAGHIGSALAHYSNLSDYGIKIIAAFDIDRKKIGKKINDIEIFSIDKMPNLIRRMNVKIGIIATPPDTAQEIANMMIDAGIEGIWNFTPVHIAAPENIVIENAQLTLSLAVLTRRIVEKKYEKTSLGEIYERDINK